MPIEVEIRREVTVVAVAGSIDSQTAPGLQEEIMAAVKSLDRVVLDLAAVDYMSSAGLRMLLSLYREFTARKGRIVLVGVCEEIRDVMSHTGFLSFFTLVDSRDEGVDLLKAQP